MRDCVESKTGCPDPVETMSQGGDGRIRLDPATGLNRYHSAPAPSEVLAYASSTANDISPAAFAHVQGVLAEITAAADPDRGDGDPLIVTPAKAGVQSESGLDPGLRRDDGYLSAHAYAHALERLRGRIRDAYGLGEDVAVVFAPSGTDLEYVALACVSGRAPGGTHNILLGADEVGSGCIHSAHGRYFAETTALGVATKAGEPVPGMDGVLVDLVDIPVRDKDGRVRRSAEIAERMAEALIVAKAASRHVLVHVVHGSKTGLILPAPGDIDRIRAEHEDEATLVVDACQARITSAAVRDYLAREAIVFVTGSKFMGGPPFSGFALVPRGIAEAAPALPPGMATIFRRAEWPQGWPGAETLEASANAGLLLRLEASIFELERFQQLDAAAAERVILAFHAAVRAEIVAKIPARRVAPYPPGDKEEADTHPVEMRTLSTLDLSRLGTGALGLGTGGATFEDAQQWHKALLAHGVRLGQPVKCVRLANGEWGATLRIGLTMWQVADRASLSDEALAQSFAADMARVREALVVVAN